MKVILTKQCESLTGSLQRGFGYHIEKRKNGFFTKRSQRAIVPHDGHIRFIFACAELSKTKIHIEDLRLSAEELYDALYEAHYWIAARVVKANADAYVKTTYNATDILNLKITFGL